jgi:hypothetical protein
LLWAASVVRRYGGPATQSTGEPVFTHLPALTGALRWVSREGNQQDVQQALPVADVVGAAWERIGELTSGRAALDALLAAVERTGVDDPLAVARVLRRRARLCMRTHAIAAAHADLQRAYDLCAGQDELLTISVMLDRADLAMTHGDWDTAFEVVPELRRRTEATGDPLLQAMGRNRTGWAHVGRRELVAAQQCYEQAWAQAEVHEDLIVESRSAAGLALVAVLTGDTSQGRHFWQHALGLAEGLHDRGFVVHCVDGVAVLLSLTGRAEDGRRLAQSVTAVRVAIEQPREAVMQDLYELVERQVPEPLAFDLWSYTEAVSYARQRLVEPT